MARLRIFMVLVLALTAGSAFAFGTYRYIQQVPERGEGIETRPVIVAAVNLCARRRGAARGCPDRASGP